ncbi:MAG: hemolysin family protein [Lachnospiraceae bacterium]|nr:hemolysin family protein [Lachnospiraceae bacterium]
MDTIGVLQLLCIFLLLLLSAFFSSAETSLTTVNKLKIRSLVDEGNKRAIVLTNIQEHSGKMLSAILIGNNIVNISASSLTTMLAIRVWGSNSVGIVTGFLTLIILVFGEITPKTMATLYAEELALFYAPIIIALINILTPIIFFIDKISKFVLRIFRVDISAGSRAMTESELKTIVDVSHEDGVIESDERKMIYNVFDFGSSYAKDIMVPRIHMRSVESSSSYEEVLQIFKEEKYTRLPVYEDDTDNIIGMIIMKDFFLSDSKKFFKIRDMLREVYYTYEYKITSELMMEMQKNSMSMAIVINEYGAAVGLITMEDLLEEIVGEIRDEYDEDEIDLIKEIGEREYLVEGSVKIDDLNEALSLNLESEDYDSVAGLIIDLLDRLPEVGEKVETEDHIILEVVSTSRNRIDKVHLYLPEPSALEEDLELLTEDSYFPGNTTEETT